MRFYLIVADGHNTVSSKHELLLREKRFIYRREQIVEDHAELLKYENLLLLHNIEFSCYDCSRANIILSAKK
jgi:hypothetical protein